MKKRIISKKNIFIWKYDSLNKEINENIIFENLL